MCRSMNMVRAGLIAGWPGARLESTDVERSDSATVQQWKN